MGSSSPLLAAMQIATQSISNHSGDKKTCAAINNPAKCEVHTGVRFLWANYFKTADNIIVKSVKDSKTWQSQCKHQICEYLLPFFCTWIYLIIKHISCLAGLSTIFKRWLNQALYNLESSTIRCWLSCCKSLLSWGYVSR